jgi:hypothetical protein
MTAICLEHFAHILLEIINHRNFVGGLFPACNRYIICWPMGKTRRFFLGETQIKDSRWLIIVLILLRIAYFVDRAVVTPWAASCFFSYRWCLTYCCSCCLFTEQFFSCMQNKNFPREHASCVYVHIYLEPIKGLFSHI